MPPCSPQNSVLFYLSSIWYCVTPIPVTPPLPMKQVSHSLLDSAALKGNWPPSSAANRWVAYF